jgi:hypothetical protein
LADDTKAPYSFNWTNIPSGTYNVTARAYDNVGGMTTSSVRTVIVNAQPKISITSPLDGAVNAAPRKVNIFTAASDADGTIQKVEFFVNGTKLSEDLITPYNSYAILDAGTYTFVAKVTDNMGATVKSTPVTLTIRNDIAPQVSIVTPSNNITIAPGSNLLLEAKATDADGQVVQVDFLANTTLLYRFNTVFPYIYNWNNIPAGTYEFKAIAKDELGVTTTSAPVVITVK